MLDKMVVVFESEFFEISFDLLEIVVVGMCGIIGNLFDVVLENVVVY